MGGMSRCDHRKDILDDALDITNDIVVPVSQHMPAGSLEIGSANIILLKLLGMMPAIELDRDTQRAARKIYDEVADDQLAGEAGTMVAQMEP